MMFWNIAEETKKEKERLKEEEMLRKMDERRNRFLSSMQNLNGDV